MREAVLLDLLPMGVVVIDHDYVVRRWNRWMEIHTDISASQIVGNAVFDHYPGLNRKSFIRACKSSLTFGNIVYLSQKLHRYLFPIRLGVRDDVVEYMQQSCTITPVRDDDGNIEMISIAVLDVTDSVRLEERLRRLNQVDSLTGAFNRRFLDSRLPEEIERHRRYRRCLSVLMVDIDHFKAVNDNRGHLVGDRVLIRVSELCREELRITDHFVRFGGEEFVAVLPETTRDEAIVIAERVRERVEQTPVDADDEPVSVTVSIGVAGMHGESANPDGLLERADSALYRAKNSGRNAVAADGQEGA